MLPYLPGGNGLSSLKKCILTVLFIFFLAFMNAKSCIAREIPVELVWNFKDAGWLGVSIEAGNYRLIVVNEKTGGKLTVPTKETACTPGSSFECGWGGFAPIFRLEDKPFEIWRGAEIELRTLDSNGVFKVQTPDGKAVRYRGSLLLSWKGDHWSLINLIDQEEYLKGVVPIEMSNAWAQDGLEALKAQAVAARTYLVKKLQTASQITDSPDYDQAYLGKEVEGQASKAIAATKGEILVDNQTRLPIDALYSSHNGGFTEKAENVWSNRDPHFSSHPDPFSMGMGGAADQWRFIISADELGKTFQLDPIQEIQLDKYPSGRVKKVRMTDLKGKSKEIPGRTFVQAFYPFGHPIHSEAFLGSLFEVQKVPGQAETRGPYMPGQPSQWKLLIEPQLINGDAAIHSGPRLDRVLSSSLGVREFPSSEGIFIFWGRGWGHGVGMSQWGAYHMAQLGYSYREILNYYYDNTDLAQQ